MLLWRERMDGSLCEEAEELSLNSPLVESRMQSRNFSNYGFSLLL